MDPTLKQIVDFSRDDLQRHFEAIFKVPSWLLFLPPRLANFKMYKINILDASTIE